MFNVVTSLIVRDGLEVLVGCYFAYLAAGKASLRLVPFAFIAALLLAITGHILISELDENFRPVELSMNLIVPAAIMVFCLTHLPRKRAPSAGTYFAVLLVLGETAEVAISTMEQNGREIRDGVITGAGILMAITAAVWFATHRWGHDVKELVKAHMTSVMSILNLSVGAFGLYVLSNVREPLGEYHAKQWWPVAAVIYCGFRLWVVAVTVSRLLARSGTVPHPTREMQ